MSAPENHQYYQSLALINYEQYLQVQSTIDRVEAQALRAASDSKRAAKNILLEPANESPASFYYKSLCSDRARFMQLAQLNATMAMMLSGNNHVQLVPAQKQA